MVRRLAGSVTVPSNDRRVWEAPAHFLLDPLGSKASMPDAAVAQRGHLAGARRERLH